mmetsp:Transcript_11552/g.11568  ORF Transcript_11552/g.11568 Transcript_11552/m.11568 type:complete len:288 (+) Transcript_11552:145-1008(+)
MSNPKASPSISETWTILATNVNVRDKSLKVIQYGSRMLLGFYGSALPDSAVCTLENMRNSSLMARKAFRLLKSLNNISIIAKTIQDSEESTEDVIPQALKVFEHVCWSLFFYYCNRNFLTIHKVIKTDMDAEKILFYKAWFGADSFFMLGNIYQLVQWLLKKKNAYNNLERIQQHKLNKNLNTNNIDQNNNISYQSFKSKQNELSFGSVEEEESYVLKEIEGIDKKLKGILWNLLNGLFRITVSSNNYPICFWKRIFGEKLSEGPIGLSGMMTAFMIIYESWPHKKA